MANILEPLSYARPTRTYVGAPVEEIQKLGETLDTRYRENRAKANQINNIANNLDVREVNRSLVDQEITQYNDKLKALSAAGNYENLSNELDTLANDFNSNKILTKAVEDKKKSAAWRGEIESMYKEGKIDYTTYQNTLKFTDKQNNKALVYNPVTKTYDNIFSGFNPAEYQDISKAMLDMAKDWKADSKPVTVTYKKGGKDVTSQIVYDPMGKGFFFAGTTKSVPEDELQSALTDAIMNNPKYMAYINQNLMFLKENKLASRPSKQIYETDIVSSNPADGALFNISIDEFKKQIEEAGYKYDEMMADPEMREAMYDSMYRKKVINDYVNPAVQKEGYSETDLKLYDDKAFLENLKAANDLKLQRQKAHDDTNLEMLKNSFEKERAISYLDSQPGTLVGNPFVLDKIPGRLGELNQSITKLEGDIKAGNVDYATAMNTLKQYQQEKTMLDNVLRIKQTNYIDTAEGLNYINNQYDKFVEASRRSGKTPESKEWFKQEILKSNNTDLAYNKEKATNNPFAFLGGGSETSQFRGHNSRGGILQDTWTNLKTKSQVSNSESLDFGNSSFTNVLSGFGDVNGTDATTIDIYNKGLTLSLNNYSKDYLAWTPTGLIPLEDIKKDKKYKEKEIELVGGFYDGPIYDTWYYQTVVKDKKTGETLDVFSVMPKDQNTATQNYADLNKDIAASRGNDVFGRKAQQTLAHIAFPDLKTSQLSLELSKVDEDSEPGVASYSTIKEVGNAKFIISKEKVSIPLINDEGKVTGSAPKIVYKAIRAKDTSSSQTKIDNNNIGNYLYGDGKQSKVLVNPNYASNPKAIELGISNYFNSIEDIKSTLYSMQQSRVPK
jgi:hypothetical protein